MSLGGYKFVGYHYTVPSDYDSSDEAQVKSQCLRMFKCRLKAFIDSCTASGAEWEFSYTNGQNSFGTYGNVIYTLDDEGYNFGCFFKYHGKEQYMALVNYNKGSGFSSQFWYRANSNYSYTDYGVSYSTCGTLPITPNNWNTTQQGTLRMRSGGYMSTSTTLTPSAYDYYYGFATKGPDVITISYGSNFSSGINQFKVMSPDGFITLCDPSDTYPVFDITETGLYSAYTSGTFSFMIPMVSFCQSLTNTGSLFRPYYGDSYNESYFCIYPQKESAYTSPNDNIPYSAVLLTTNMTVQHSNSEQVPSTNGFLSKGYIKPELLAINSPCSTQEVGNYRFLKPYANGNYLLFRYSFYTGNNPGTIPQNSSMFANAFLYCGWDSSNPDITQSSSWVEYTD